ncbi:DNA-processing protein DprA [Streptomyces sp. NPDC050504]|uniref:DNA-processing protein DprA n=1 Tax=Streptomyces sp. NPDC050504 TaxID=3365618 RepID=UPI00378D2B47
MSGAVSDEERLARAALCRAVEPGDELGGRWLREYGAVGALALLRARAEPGGGDAKGATGAEADAEAEGERGGGARSAGGAGGAVGGCGGAGGGIDGAGRRRGRAPVRGGRVEGWRLRIRDAEPERDLAAIGAAGGRFVCPGDAEWPSQLDDLGDARPIGLWVRGRPDLRMWALRSVAVVGARACTPYGAHMAASLGAGLAERGWVVVSGAAYGIDGAAHRGALASGGATAAVLACGVDVAYPRGHTELLARIAEQGLVIGELPPGEHPTPSRFVLRNRVIAALTRGTVVVEAEYRSGSLVTARAAQRAGRFTMGVPGPATSGLSAGVHELLRGDAVLVTDADEVVELVGDMGALAPDRRGPVLPRDLLGPVAARVLEALPARGTADCRAVARGAGTGADEALGKLYELQALGFVERAGDGWRLAARAARGADPRRGGT